MHRRVSEGLRLALTEFERQSWSLWRITNECVNCLLLATLVGMRSQAAGVDFDCSVSSLVLLVLFWRGPIESIGAPDPDKDDASQWER